MKRLHLLSGLLLLVTAAIATSQQPASIPARPIEGALVIHGGGPMPDAVAAEFVRLAGGESARLVVIPTAAGGDPDDAKRRRLIDAWTKRGISDVTILHTRDRAQSDDQAFTAPLRDATAVWFEGGLQARLESAYVGTRVERELHAMLRRGGVIGGTSAGAAIMSRVMIRQGSPLAEVGTGLGFITGCVIDQHFGARNRQTRLKSVLADRPGLFGLGIDESTAIVVRGREIRVVGESQVVVCLSPSKQRPARTITLSHGDRADVTQLSRAAIDRAGEPFPPIKTAPSTIANGTLVIVGGGGLPPEAMKRFVNAAGGPNARIVIVPTAAGTEPQTPRSLIRMLESMGVKDVRIVHAVDAEAARDPALLEHLKDATGVWFGGGRQWRLLDAFEGTPIIAAFHDVLRRGGAIGGSSAGATIQGEYLVRGHPLGNQVMMAEGYERGFAFLPGAAIDQHFTQRNRFDDLARVKQAFPQLLCLGIDESTALIVTPDGMEVVGDHHVYIFDGDAKVDDADGVEQPFKKLGAGERYVPADPASPSPPYPPSPIIERIEFDFTTHRRLAPGSDNWPVSWADDGHLYTAWGDGGGFGGTNRNGRVKLGVARIEGDAAEYVGTNVWGGFEPENPATFEGKSYGILSVDGVLYMWVSPQPNPHLSHCQLAWSKDRGATWQRVEWRFRFEDELTIPTLLNFGRDYAGARDGYVYSYYVHPTWGPGPSTRQADTAFDVHRPGRVYLSRVPRESILDRDRYEFFAGFANEGAPAWSADVRKKHPVFEDANGVGWNLHVSYNAGLKRYMLCTQHLQNAAGNLGIFDAAEPWGPWTTVAYEQAWGADHIEPSTWLWHFNQKWLSGDGTNFTMIFTGKNSNDSWNTVAGRFVLKERPR